MLDEPTNHLDIETIDVLVHALNEWDEGLVLVNHDFRLINQVAKEIWVCENRSTTKWGGDIMDFKQHLKKNIGLLEHCFLVLSKLFLVTVATNISHKLG